MLLFPLPLVPLLLFLVLSVERKAFGTQQGQNSPCAELQQSHSQPAEFEANFGGHFKKTGKTWSCLSASCEEEERRMCRRCHVPFPKGWEMTRKCYNSWDSPFFVLMLVQSLLFLSSSLLTGCFMGLPLFSWAAEVVISGCSHSISNMFPVSGFQLRRLVALIECYWTILILENYCVK